MDPEAHKQFRQYTCDEISTLSWDPESQSHIPFRASLRHKHHTWAKTYYSYPELYLQPQSEKEIGLIVALARQCRKRIIVVGSGHSPSDLTCTSSWIVNLDGFCSVVSEDAEKKQIAVQAGIRLHQLLEQLDKRGWTMPNLGSITAQSIAGAIATSTHGSSLKHGLLSDSVISITIMMANGKSAVCSLGQNRELYQAALVSLGGLGIITHVTFQAVPAFNLAWEQSIVSLPRMLESWDKDLWTQSEFSRVWWFPYSRRTIVWRADKTDEPLRNPPHSWYGAGLGRFTYEFFLYIARWFPSLTPMVEKYVFYMQYGWKEGKTGSAVQRSHHALTMDCLFSQLVNEWAIPLEKGPEAISRLQAWLNGDQATSKIPFPADGIYVHAPIEVRISDTTASSSPRCRPWLDQSCATGPTLYLNATLYRPFLSDIPEWKRYYEAFEWLMKEMGGKPHWAKNFITVSKDELSSMYPHMEDWVSLRNQIDPEGMFASDWLKRNILGDSANAAKLTNGVNDSSIKKHGAAAGKLSAKPATDNIVLNTAEEFRIVYSSDTLQGNSLDE
ncbi:D-arabinono-1,4-lactone oxidase [Rhizina undulata]